MKGNETFKLAVKTLTSDVIKCLKNINFQMKTLHFIPHQTNYRNYKKAVGEALNLTEEQTVITVDKVWKYISCIDSNGYELCFWGR